MIDRNRVNTGHTINQLPYTIPTQAAPFAVGTAMLFQQTTAPAGWVKVVTNNDAALRVISGTTGGSFTAGSDFSTTLTAQANNATASLNATTLSSSQIPAHTHLIGVTRTANAPTYIDYGGYPISFFDPSVFLNSGASTTTISGPNIPVGGGSHTHSTTGALGTSINLSVYYVDIIIATKS